MTVAIEKIVKATWTCDWCMVTEVTDSEIMPANWEDGSGGDSCNGEHWCSYAHYRLHADAWEDGFESGLEAQVAYSEEIRMKWNREN